MNGQKAQVKRVGWLACLALLLISACAPSAEAQTRLIVRDSLGLPGINLTCLLAGCKVVGGLGDPNGQLFLVTFPPILSPVTSLLRLNLQTGILSVEVDQVVTPSQPDSGAPPLTSPIALQLPTTEARFGTAISPSREIS